MTSVCIDAVPPTQEITENDTAAMVARVLLANQCSTNSDGETSMAANAAGDSINGNGLLSGSVAGQASGQFQVTNEGCDTLAALATAYLVAHNDMACLINNVRQQTSTSTKFTQTVKVVCDYCDANINLNQTIQSNGFTSQSFNDELVSELEAKSFTFIDNIQEAANKNEQGFGRLAQAAKAGVSFSDTNISAKDAIASSDLIQNISSDYMYNQKTTYYMYDFKGNLTINQSISSQMIATNILSSSLAYYFNQLDYDKLSNVMDLQNINDPPGIDSLFSAFSTIWIVGILVLVVLMVVMFKKPSATTTGDDGVKKPMIQDKAKRVLIIGMLFGALMIGGAILFAVYGNWVAFGICLAIAILLISIVGYWYYKNKGIVKKKKKS